MAFISLDTAALLSTALEGILYGEYLDQFVCPVTAKLGFSGFSVLMFIGTMWALTYKRSIRDLNRPVAVAAVLLLVLSTAVSSSPLSFNFIY
jgi:FtsH-binding integral membrane protein